MRRYAEIVILMLGALVVLPGPCSASNFANPAGMVPAGRIVLGASYHLGGYSITDDDVGMIFNRFHARVGYSPLRYVNFGIDLGASQMDVDSQTYFPGSDTVYYKVFQGKYGFSGGLHLKGATPRFFNDMMSVFGMAQATMFSSSNEDGAQYGGFDGAGVLGLQFRVPKFGFVSVGAKLYYIEGDNLSYTGKEGSYSNTDNLQAWLALDFLPPFGEQMKGKPYFSAEITLVPNVSMGGSVPIQGISFSFSVGWISPRLYGEDFEDIE
ncbi:MAG: hypothetical protein GF331_12780 [Chitinivibrionales bacterium]|nr:hypothetical protein [Chitinivibrionales bacterium]